MNSLLPLAAIVAAYLIGSLSFAVIVSRVMGLNDPRSYGSGNPGATNVLRSGNKKAALLTLLFDALKGYLPVLAVGLLQDRLHLSDTEVGLVGLAAFLGHLWPVFFRFQGGKGVATAAGVILGLNPALGGLTLLTWLAVAYVTRYSSLAALVAAVCVPLYEMLIWGPSGLLLSLLPMSLLLLWRHEGNIRKLIAGTESKIGQKAATAPAPNPEYHSPHAHSAHHHQHRQRGGRKKGKH